MSFKPHTFEEAREKFKPMKSTGFTRKENTGLAGSPARWRAKTANEADGGGKTAQGLNTRKRLVRKPTEWDRIRPVIKSQFANRGVITCQLRLPGCWFDNALSFAHPAKRDRLRPGELWIVALCCTPCHGIIEVLPADEMRSIVESAYYSVGIRERQ